MSARIRVLVVDDHAVVRTGLRRVLDSEKDIVTVGEAASAERAVFEALEHKPDVVLLDVVMPGKSGIEGLPARLPTLSAAHWAVIFAVGLSSGASYGLWLWALKHTASTKATTFLALSPVTATLIGTFVLGEPLGAGLVLGVACIVLGLLLTASRRSAVRQEAAPTTTL